MTWHILRVTHGNPFKITEAIDHLLYRGYCPAYVERRRDPRDKRRILDVRKPMLPGYVFSDAHFDTSEIGPMMLALAKVRAEASPLIRQKPVTIDFRAKWLTLDGRPVTMTERAMTALEEAERTQQRAFRPLVEEIVQALVEISRGVRRKNKYVKLNEFKMEAA